MQEKKPPAREQVTKDKLTLRISSELNCITKDKAEYLGISQNAFLVMLVDIGLRCYEVSPHLLKDE